MKPFMTMYRLLMPVIVLALLVVPSTVTANNKAELLRQTMADIALLNSQMAQRKTDAGGIRDALSAQLEAIKTEARREWREKGIDTEAEALKNPRLLFDLMLMAEIQAYIQRYTQKIGDYRVACDRLSYLYQQADDDLKIVSTLSGMKIDALISTAEKILDGYRPEAQAIVIQPDKLTIETPEKMWETLTRVALGNNKYQKTNIKKIKRLSDGWHQGPADDRIFYFRNAIKTEDAAVLQLKYDLVRVAAHHLTDQPLQKGQVADQHDMLLQFEAVGKSADIIHRIHSRDRFTPTGGR